jgi:hypothetical protein
MRKNDKYINKYVKNREKLFIHVYSRQGVYKGKACTDADMYEYVKIYKWYFCATSGYAKATINGELVHLHTFIIGKKEGYVADHINRDRLDNRRVNLRFVTRRENNVNRVGVGVRKTPCGKWNARFRHNGKEHHIGNYDSIKEAKNAYLKKKYACLKMIK